MSLSTKIISMILLILTLLFSISGWVSVIKEKEILNNLLENKGKSISHAIAVFCIETLLSEDYPVLNTFLETTGRERDDILLIRVIHNNSLVSEYSDKTDKKTDMLIFSSDIIFSYNGSSPEKLGEVHLGLSVLQNRQLIGTRIQELILNTTLIFLILFLTLIIMIRKIILDKLEQFSGDAKRIKNGDFDLRVNIKTGDEFGELASAFNEMLDTIKIYQEHLEQMVEERTNELRETQKELILKATDAGIEAGRSQLSAMVLHNIGNAATPIKIQTESLKTNELRQIAVYLEKCYKELTEHTHDLNYYITEDQRGKEIFTYMGSLINSLSEYDNKRASSIEKISTSVSYISDILTIHQGHAASEQEIREQTNLNNLIEDSLNMQSGSLEKREIISKKDLTTGLPKLIIDKNRLMQVIVNFIKNSYEAIDAVENTGKEKKIAICSFKDENHVGFSIIDTGIGIEPKNMDRIFEFGSSLKGSSGVGLHYCKMFIEANKGTISISSPGPGKGAKIKVSFEI
ncbi:ATP-binding protein [Desulfobacterales bacterium HSG17]|nr:ATP-binding protein [Desulfobacterales bacterium HSG17]